MTFSKFSEHLSKIESTTKRNEMTRLLVELFKEATPVEIDNVVYLSLGQLAPLFAHKEFGLADKMVIKAIARTYKKDDKAVRTLYQRMGDLGATAEEISKEKSGILQSPSVTTVFEKLVQITRKSGEGSQEHKLLLTSELLHTLDPQGVRYIVRIILGTLRLGFSDKTILDALSVMTTGDKSGREQIESAYNVRPDVGWLAKQVKLAKSPKLPKFPQIGVPIIPALCQRLPSTEEIIKKMGTVAVEPKWDGQRIQAHVSKKEIKLFTRSLENVTDMFPDLTDALSVISSSLSGSTKLTAEVLRAEGLSEQQRVEGSSDTNKISSAILDGEVVGFDTKSGKFLPFQTTITRKRKYGIAEHLLSVPIRYMVFDILFLNGQSVMEKPFSERRAALEKLFSPNNQQLITNNLSLAPQIVTDSPTIIREYLHKQIASGLEGIVTKQWKEPYVPGRTGFTWVKMKWEGKAKSGGLLDTVDCLVMGTYAGRGKRSDFGIGAFLVGIWDEKSNTVKTIAKIGTGLSDAQWRELKKTSVKLHASEIPPAYDVPKELTPHTWMMPKVVVEIQADNITQSPLHTAHYALRFPRLVRYRTDKQVDQITTMKEIQKLYDMQEKS